MKTETIYYKDRTGRNTKDVLRELRPQDEMWLRMVFMGYRTLSEIDNRRGFKDWFNMPNTSLPKQPMKNNLHNSPASFCDGMMEKLHQGHGRRDLSPRQCDGIEALSQQMADLYENAIPVIAFKNKSAKTIPASQVSFDEIFKQVRAKQ